jgi:hypothetical protein
MTVEPAGVQLPKHPLYALTTSELSGHRRQLENAIAYCDGMDPVPQARGDLQARLDDVIAEQVPEGPRHRRPHPRRRPARASDRPR